MNMEKKLLVTGAILSAGLLASTQNIQAEEQADLSTNLSNVNQATTKEEVQNDLNQAQENQEKLADDLKQAQEAANQASEAKNLAENELKAAEEEQALSQENKE